ncbi:hypothetical protein P3T76_014350 [Phytophthora citrophthora]|uniref:Uncharacterized protein n=1 Tax=Phytophthora citrophthora TaxID=4793 RepID=A0AAD9G1M1_9STRA|nr:hypothetical protein P3T76_014350 [Phytophthora citrophthora]
MAFFGDPDSILARCLQKLLADTFGDENFSDRSRPDVGALLELLGRNRTLQFLEVITHPQNSNYENEFRKFHLQSLTVQESPLPMECKTVFFSVCLSTSRHSKKSRRDKEPSRLPSLDSLVVSKIFEFAAEPVKRTVFFTKQLRSPVRFYQRSL